MGGALVNLRAKVFQRRLHKSEAEVEGEAADWEMGGTDRQDGQPGQLQPLREVMPLGGKEGQWAGVGVRSQEAPGFLSLSLAGW